MTNSDKHSTHSRVVIVDDDGELLRGLKLSLETEPLEVICVARPEEALGIIRRVHPDVVVLDVMMPGVDGWQVLSALRQDGSGVGEVPVLMLTAKDSIEAKVTGYTLGADDYLTKPFSVQELRCRIAALLRRSRTSTRESVVPSRLPVLVGAGGQQLVSVDDVFFVTGIRNYSYVHTFDCKSLCRLRLWEIDELEIEPLMRVHRSFIVNLNQVRRACWPDSSTFTLFLSNQAETAVPVGRKRVSEVQHRLGLK